MKLKKSKKFESGAVFSIDLGNGKFAFGCCLIKVSIGHLVEIFDFFSTDSSLEELPELKRLAEPVIIDDFSLFSKKIKEGNWNVIGKIPAFTPSDIDHLKFTYGTGAERFVTDARGNIDVTTKEKAAAYPVYSPKGNKDIVDMIALLVNGG